MTLNSPKIIEILEDKVMPGSMHLQGGENFSAGGINELMLFTHVPKYQPGHGTSTSSLYTERVNKVVIVLQKVNKVDYLVE